MAKLSETQGCRKSNAEDTGCR